MVVDNRPQTEAYDLRVDGQDSGEAPRGRAADLSTR
jgi:hypothetical protein